MSYKVQINDVVRDATAEETAYFEAKKKKYEDNLFSKTLNDFRVERNFKLEKTDWTSSSDLTMSAEMKEYRQKLRDATEGLDTVEKIQAYKFPDEVTK
jgi:hypothetical protein|tara:strand:- start:31 stop:324 length:294 start_codon:yes stop_codon:yes gene_type:complete